MAGSPLRTLLTFALPISLRSEAARTNIPERPSLALASSTISSGNAGVPFAQIGPGTYYVVAGLLFGKPIGILLFTRLARVAGGPYRRDLDPALYSW